MEIIITLNAGSGVDFGPTFSLSGDTGVISPNTALLSELLTGKTVTVDPALTYITILPLPIGLCPSLTLYLYTTTTTTSTSTTTAPPSCSFGDGNLTVFYRSTPVGRGLLYNGYVQYNASPITINDDWRIAGGLNRDDYNTLLTYIDSEYVYGIGSGINSLIFKEAGNKYWNTDNGLNTYNFNARGTGYLAFNGNFSGGYDYCALGCRDGWDGPLVINDAGLTQWYGGMAESWGVAIRLMRDNLTSEELALSDGTYTSPYIANNGVSHRTVKIGTQIWLADNLTETQYRDGSVILQVFDAVSWINANTALSPCCVSYGFEINQGLDI
jgi:hypothetical protein